jgi:hypothetical protein
LSSSYALGWLVCFEFSIFVFVKVASPRNMFVLDLRVCVGDCSSYVLLPSLKNRQLDVCNHLFIVSNRVLDNKL